MESREGDKSGVVIATGIAMLSMSIVAVSIRFATRIQAKYGLGKHVEHQLSSMVEPYQKALLVSSPSYSVSAALIKLSLLAFYLRLSRSMKFRISLCDGIRMCWFGVASVVTVTLQCIPLSMLWDSTKKGSCIQLQTFYYANAALNLATDFTIYAMPIPMLWRLHLPTIQRIGLCAVLSMGAVAVFASIYRLCTLHLLISSSDVTWNITSPIIWSTIELNVAITSSCVPAFKGCLNHFLPHFLGSLGSGSGSNKNSTAGRSRSRKSSFPLESIYHEERARNTTKVVGGGEHGYWEGSEEELVEEGRRVMGILERKEVWVEHEDIGKRVEGSAEGMN
ncbi:hypothetical protein B0O99DRAFT_668439 [Bisporella sp. PMI_857]|nr:hypothetical protein B0O99DRAFT_668439 [Bisporella sp. PMI_857]